MATPIPTNHAKFDAKSLAEVLKSSTDPAIGADPVGVCTDSRAIKGGEIFVALRGANADGHTFLSAAEQNGAAAAVVDQASDSSSLPQFVVEDTLSALGRLAQTWKRSWNGTAIAITGSAGKTTTKELLSSALGSASEVHRTAGNLNNRIGLPHVLFGLQADHKYAVVEIGTSLRGEIETLTEMTEPDVGIVTLVAPAHTEGLGTLSDVAEEKCALLEGLPSKGVGIWNTDVSVLERRAAAVHRGTALRYGSHDRADIRLRSWRITEQCASICLYDTPSGPAEVALNLVGEAAVRNVGAVLAAAVGLGLDLGKVVERLGTVEHVAGRMEPKYATSGLLVIDDTYNASPASVDRALETLAALPTSGKRVAVLGDMLELGSLSDDHHRLALERALDSRLEHLVVCGQQMSAAAAALRTDVRIHSTKNSAEAAELARSLIAKEDMKKGDVVLVKGSRSMYMEHVVKALLENGTHAEGEAA